MSMNAWNPTLYDQKHAFVFEYGRDIVSLLAPQADERILDLGCGTGHLTALIAASGAKVVGIDASPSMIEAAQTAYPQLEFTVADATTFALPYALDAVFSNAVLHWIPDSDAVAERIAHSLKPGGRFVAEFGGKGNIALIIAAADQVLQDRLGLGVQHPWYYPSIGEYATVLERHGLEVRSAVLFDRLTRLEGEKGMRNWFEMFGDALLARVPAERRPEIVAAIEDRLRGRLYRDGHWYADYRRLRLVAYAPSGPVI